MRTAKGQAQSALRAVSSKEMIFDPFFTQESLMSLFFRLALPAALLVLAGLVSPTGADTQPAEKKKPKPKVEVVFCLDTTGSMGGLIDGAK